jgi:hypothetical protein
MVCGTNHNETLVRDVSNNQLEIWPSAPMGSKQEFADTGLFLFSLIYKSGGCSARVCGSNNEILLRTTANSSATDSSIALSTLQHRSRLK